jgi:peptidyl-tRNA hydrolase, PTH1 family
MKWLRRHPERAAKPEQNRPSDPMRVVVGLRNPGAEYEGTRHNAGFLAVDHLLALNQEKWHRAPSRVRCQTAQLRVGQEQVLIAAPLTFMNESGGAVRALLDYYSTQLEGLLVVHDDIDLAFGRLRVQVGGGSGGHNGVRSIESALGSAEFTRLKMGVGRPPGSMDPADFVLRRFTKTEQAEVALMVADAVGVIEQWFDDPASAQETAAHRGRP